MLAQNFMTAAELNITNIELRSLIGVLGMLERGELVHRRDPFEVEVYGSNEFNMGMTVDSNCGTIGCIAGWAYYLSGGKAFPEIVDSGNDWNRDSGKLRDLFGIGKSTCFLDRITPVEAACALRSYLSTGFARWDLARASI